MQYKSTMSLLATTALVFFSSDGQGANLEIRQQPYTYQMAVTKDFTTETFVITTSKQQITNPQAGTTPEPLSLSPGISYPVVHFQLGSADLTAGVAEAVLENLRQAHLEENTPLAVIGYTCSRGTEDLNQALSTRRAETVATLLRQNGFMVRQVQGRGAADPVTSDPEQQYRNRRVEIKIFDR